MSWELVSTLDAHTTTYRMAVPGGWIFRTIWLDLNRCCESSVFVSDPNP